MSSGNRRGFAGASRGQHPDGVSRRHGTSPPTGPSASTFSPITESMNFTPGESNTFTPWVFDLCNPEGIYTLGKTVDARLLTMTRVC